MRGYGDHRQHSGLSSQSPSGNYNEFMRTPKSAAPVPRPTRRPAHSREGLRPVRIWIPDLDDATFRAEAHRQSLAAASSLGEQEDQAFVDAISDPLPTK
jgi:hypothetical protein